VEELSQTRVLGSKEGNALGIEGFGDDHIFVLEQLLRGKSLAEIRQLTKTDEFQRFAALDDQLETLAGTLQNSPLFKTMLSE
jgi:inosine/xanthosine triphosphate pyrophosphatase family protein